MDVPRWLKPLGVVVAVLLAAIFLAGELGVIYRGVKAPEGYDQSRLHWNTKNSTRFWGDGPDEVATRVIRAVYPATEAANTPSTVILYDAADWRGGLAAASLLRPLDGVFALLLNRTLVVPGWEQLYSMTPGTFLTFWIGIGVALGHLLGGVGAVLAVPGPREDGEASGASRSVAGTGGRARRGPRLAPVGDGTPTRPALAPEPARCAVVG